MLGRRLRRLHSIGALVLAIVLGPLAGGHQAFGAEQAPPSVPTAYDDFYYAGMFPVEVHPPGVLANDLSNGGGPMWVYFEGGDFLIRPDGGFGPLGSMAPVTLTARYRAVNGVGASNLATVTFTIHGVPAPPAPTLLRARSIVGHLVTLQWHSWLQYGEHYVVEGGLHPGEVLVSMTTRSPVITFAAPAGVFYVRVWTQGAYKRSLASNEIRIFVDVPEPPSPPAHLLGLVNGTDVSLAWRNTYAGGEPTALFLDVSGSLNGTVPLPLGESIGFGGVPAGTYTLSLRAVNAAGASAPSSAITLDVPGACSGVPLPPADLELVVNGRQVSLFWDTPIGGPAPAGFVVSVEGPLMGSFLTTARTVSAPVEPGIYTVTIATFNACGTGAANPWTFEVR